MTLSDVDPVVKSLPSPLKLLSLRNGDWRRDLSPRLIDELPVCLPGDSGSRGRTVIRDAEELKVEPTGSGSSERSQHGRSGLLTEDSMIIEGKSTSSGAQVNTFGDHRIGMTAIAAVGQSGQVEQAVQTIKTNYPSFFSDLGGLDAWLRYCWETMGAGKSQ